MTKFFKQIGQGMTEYIIIVALIAIAAIGIYTIFGDTIRGQMSSMTSELAGDSGATGGRTAITTSTANQATAEKNRTLKNFEQDTK